MYSARTYYTHQRKKSSFPKKLNIQSLVGLHLSCFNILLSCGRFIITIIPTCLSENWFYATRLNGVLRKKNHHIGWNKNRKRNNKQVRGRCKWRIYLSSVESSGEWKIYIHRLFCHWKGADKNRLFEINTVFVGTYLEELYAETGREANVKVCFWHDNACIAWKCWDGI